MTGFRRRLFVFPIDAAIEDEIIAEAVGGKGRKTERVGEPQDAEIAKRVRAAADELGGDSDDETVDEFLSKQRGDDARAAFDQQRTDAATFELAKQCRKIDARRISGC